MNESTVVILLIDAAGGSVNGRTTLQKWCYFAAVKSNLDLRFAPHFYGPYAETISRTIDDLIASDFLFERGRVTYHDRVIYSYVLTDDGKNIARDLRNANPELYNLLKEIVDVCTKTVGNNISILSWAAKVYYLLQQKGKEITYDEIIEVSRNLGWELSQKEIDSGVKLLSALKLAKKTN